MVTILAAMPALRAAVTWDGGGTPLANDQASWLDGQNWNPNGIPNSNSDVIFASGFASGHNILLVGAQFVNSLTINTTTAFSITAAFPPTSNYLVLMSGDLTRNDLAGTEADQVLHVTFAMNQNGVWNINGSNSLTVDAIAQTTGGNSGLTKNGSGTLVVGDPTSQFNFTYSGGTLINDGVLRLQQDDAAGTGPVTVTAGAVLSLDGSVISNHVNLNGSGNSGNGALRSISSGAVEGTIRLDSNTTVAATDGSILSLRGAISDSASNFTLTKVGLGRVFLTAANSYGGNTTVSEGTLAVAHSNALGSGAAVTVAFGATLEISDGSTISQNVLLNGSGVGDKGALLNTFDDNTLSGVVLMQTNSTIGSTGGSLIISGLVAGNFPLVKIGGGYLVLTNANVYSGSTNIQDGVIRIRNSGALSSADVFVSNGAALELKETPNPGSVPLNVNKTIHLNGSGISSGGALRNISSNNTWAGNVILDGGTTIGVDTDTLTISGATSGAFNLTKVGPGTLILTSAANNHANTIIDAGILGLTNPNALPFGRVITVHDGGMAEFQGSIQMARSLNLNGTGVSSLGALHSPSGSTGWTSPITLQADSSIGVDAGELRISGAIGGGAALTKVGAGKLTLAASNTYSGATNITAGIVSVESNGAIPAGATAVVSPSAAIELRGGVSIPSALTLNGTGILGAGALRNVAGANTWSGPVTLNTSDASIGADAGTQLTISGPITDGTSLFPLTKVGAGTLILTNANTYGGGTLINGGTLQISANNALGAAGTTVTSNNGGKLVVDANTTTSRTFNLNNGSLQVNAGATLQYNSATVNGGFLRGPGTHQVGVNSSFNGVTALNGNSIVQSQPTTLVNFTNAGSLLSSAALTWDGGFNTPAGNITVNSAFNTQAFENDGIMTINSGGNITNTASSFVSGAGGRITINPGGQLNAGPSLELGASLLVNNGTITGTTNVNFLALAKGSGTYGPVNVLDGGRFSPGNSPGSVTTGSTTWNSGGSYIVEISDALAGAGVGWDEWNINGVLNLNATSTTNGRFTISLSTLDALAANFDNTHDYNWPILHADGGIVGFDPSDISLDTSGFKNGLGTGRFLLDSTSTDLVLRFSSVPEPQICVLSLLAAVSFTRRRPRPKRM